MKGFFLLGNPLSKDMQYICCAQLSMNFSFTLVTRGHFYFYFFVQ